MAYAGEIASLITSLCWAVNSVCFTMAGRRVGSPAVNILRLYMALAILIVIHLALFGSAFPFHPGAGRMVPLVISGLIGFALGDALLFESFLLLGARVGMLLMTLSPVFSVLLARIFLGQSLTWAKIAAILVTLVGIAWVVGEGPGGSSDKRPSHWTLGLILGTGGALGQSLGLILSDVGMAGGLNAISANLIRVVAGTVAISLWFIFRGQFLNLAGRVRDGRSTVLIAAGAITGPVIGVLFSLFAITHTSMGVAATLMSLSPVLMLPMAVVIFKERVSPRAWAGTLVSIAGAIGIFLI